MNRRQCFAFFVASLLSRYLPSHTFITETIRNGRPWEGPQFTATDFNQAEKIAKRLGVKLLGRLG